MKKLLTANRLTDGATLYLTADGSWSMALQQAWRIDAGTAGEEEAEADFMVSGIQSRKSKRVLRLRPYHHHFCYVLPVLLLQFRSL